MSCVECRVTVSVSLACLCEGFVILTVCLLLPATLRCEYAYLIAEASVDMVRIPKQVQPCHKPLFVQAHRSAKVEAMQWS